MYREHRTVTPSADGQLSLLAVMRQPWWYTIVGVRRSVRVTVDAAHAGEM